MKNSFLKEGDSPIGKEAERLSSLSALSDSPPRPAPEGAGLRLSAKFKISDRLAKLAEKMPLEYMGLRKVGGKR